MPRIDVTTSADSHDGAMALTEWMPTSPFAVCERPFVIDDDRLSERWPVDRRPWPVPSTASIVSLDGGQRIRSSPRCDRIARSGTSLHDREDHGHRPTASIHDPTEPPS
jgi:hypothetical protein